MYTIENANKAINENTVEAVVEAVEAIPVKSINWSKLGKAGAVVGVIAGIGAGTVAVIRHVKRKKQEKADVDASTTVVDVDYVKVAENDFVEHEESEE